MADGSATFDVIVNDKASGTMSKTATNAESAGSRIHKAFSSAFSSISATGVLGPFGQVLDNLDQMNDKIGGTGGKLLTMGAVGTGVGAALTMAAGGEEQAHAQLSQAITNTGHSWDDYKGKIDSTIGKMEDYGHSSADSQTALATLTTSTGSTQKALGDMSVVADLAAKKHESLADASTQVAKVLAGSGAKTLTQFGVTMDSSIKDPSARGQLALSQLAGKLKGDASASADTFSGKMTAVKTKVEDAASSLGAKYGPAITAVSTGMAGLGAGVEGAAALMGKFKTAQEGATGATEGMTAATEASDAAEDANPIGLIVIAIAGLVAGIVLLATHWKQVWGAIKDVVGDAVNFVKQHFDIIMIAVFGPFGIAIDLIKDHWRAIWADVKTVISGAYNDVLKPVFGFIVDDGIHPLMTAFDLMKEGWSTDWSIIKTVMQDAYNDVLKPVAGFIMSDVIDPIGTAIVGIKDVWQTAWGVMGSVVGDAKNVISSAWGGVSGFVKGGINDIIGAINSFIGALDAVQIHVPSIGIGPIHTPSFDWSGLNIPKIPNLSTGGVVFPRPGGTLVNLAEAGFPETVTPGLPGAAGTGAPVFQINVDGALDAQSVSHQIMGLVEQAVNGGYQFGPRTQQAIRQAAA